MNNTHTIDTHGVFRKWMPLSVIPVAFGLLTSPAVFAQEDDEIFELSPFTIEPEEGWIATETLAGTRLRTDFKDVAAQVEVFTMEFMEDYAINSLEESLIYSLNVANAEDRISGNGEGFGNQGVGIAQQIRGVGGGTTSRNFFRAFTNSENYNISRVTIASGPQSILFGTGQPSGVLDVTMNRAETSEDFGKISFQADSFDGHRVAFDYNKVIIEDKLAIRVALLNKNSKQDWKPNYDEDEREYVTVTWRPFENTTIMGHYEHAKREYSRVNRLLPIDWVTPWFGWGQPAFDNRDVDWGPINGPIGAAPDVLIYNRNNDAPTILLNDDGSLEQPTSNYRNTARIEEVINMPGVSAVNVEQDGWTLLDNSIFPTALNNNLAGAEEIHYSEADIYDVFIEQKLADNWYLELAAHQEDQKYGEWDQGIENRELSVDPNLFLGDGVTPNPHYGEFYLQGTPQWQDSTNSSEYWRATMSYELDFEDKFDSILRFFGRHRMALLKSHDREITALGQQGMRYRFLPDFNTLEEPSFANSNFNPTTGRDWARDGSRVLNARFYLNEGNGYISQPSDQTFDGRPITFQDENGKSWTIDPNNTGYFDEQGKRLVSNNAPQGINTQLDTEQFGYQGFFWNNNIVITYGYRKDESQSKNFLDVIRDRSNNPTHPNGADGLGFWPHVDDSEFGPWGEPQSGITRTKGVVVRPLSWLSLFWNESDTFQANIGRFDPYGTEYPGAQGQGQDIGIRLDLFDDKLSIKYNDFDLVSSPSRAANTPFNRWRGPVNNTAQRYRTVTGLDDYPNAGMGGFREKGGCCHWVMSDNFSTGQEISITARPIEGLNVRITYTDREAIESNIGLIWFQWIEERLRDSWTVFSVPEGGIGDPRDLNEDGGIGGIDEGFAPWTWETAWQNENNLNRGTMAEYYQDVVVNGPFGSSLIQALDGKKNEFDRASSANVNVNYRFTEGVLNGWNLGGALRWRDAPTVGYEEILVSGIESPNLEKPLAGAIDMTYDVTIGYRGKIKLFGDRNYTVRGTIRNLLDDGPTFPVIKSVDGNNIRVARKTPRLFILSVDVDL
jgi:outer membrane receptor protein involved in Fe transport